MAQQIIGLGTSPNDGTGDNLRAAGQKVNEMFTEIYDGELDNIEIVSRNAGIIDWSESENSIEEQIELHVATSLLQFTITGNQLLIFELHKWTANGIEVHKYVSKSGKGTYGAGTSPTVMFLSIKYPSSSDSPNSYDLGEIGIYDEETESTHIEYAVNNSGPYPINQGNTNIFTVTRDGAIFNYLFQGNLEPNQSTIGAGQPDTSADDYLYLGSENIQPVSEYGEEDVIGTARQFTKAQNFAVTQVTDAATLDWNLVDKQSSKVELTANRFFPNTILDNAIENGVYSLTVYGNGFEIEFDDLYTIWGAQDINGTSILNLTKDKDGNGIVVWSSGADQSGLPAIVESVEVDGSGVVSKTKTLTLPSGAVTMADYAFDYEELTHVIIPNSITEIGEGWFEGNQIKELIIPESVTSIGVASFYINKLTSLNIPDSVTEIGADAFSDNLLTSVTLGNGLASIGNGAFQANSIVEVTFGSGLTSIGANAFTGNLLTEVDVPIGCAVDPDAFDAGVTINYV
ncbi:MAG TPA: leucine-rich repeat protein [Salinimicrobium sp.]|nr:leucine-rich repeat protein [Salinimicrobium sp.]